jgi:hypothetical protein
MSPLFKFLLAAAAAVVGIASAIPAHAVDMATMPNRDGGMIVLTSDFGNAVWSCSNVPGWNLMYMTNGYGQVAGYGCWHATSDVWMLIQYPSETSPRHYPLNSFTMTAAGNAMVRAVAH